MRINKEGYITRNHNNNDTFLVRHNSTNTGLIQLRRLSLPTQYIGKRIRIKIEIIE